MPCSYLYPAHASCVLSVTAELSFCHHWVAALKAQRSAKERVKRRECRGMYTSSGPWTGQTLQGRQNLLPSRVFSYSTAASLFPDSMNIVFPLLAFYVTFAQHTLASPFCLHPRQRNLKTLPAATPTSSSALLHAKTLLFSRQEEMVFSLGPLCRTVMPKRAPAATSRCVKLRALDLQLGASGGTYAHLWRLEL